MHPFYSYWQLKNSFHCLYGPFRSHQTGAHFIKDGKMYRVKRMFQLSQAHKANIDYRIGDYYVPETVKFEWKEDCFKVPPGTKER